MNHPHVESKKHHKSTHAEVEESISLSEKEARKAAKVHAEPVAEIPVEVAAVPVAAAPEPVAAEVPKNKLETAAASHAEEILAVLREATKVTPFAGGSEALAPRIHALVALLSG